MSVAGSGHESVNFAKVFLKSLIFLFVPLGISAWLTWLFSRPSSRFYLLDHPNERSLHDRPIPRGGGLAILAAIVVCGTFVAFVQFIPAFGWIAIGLLSVAAISFLDDRYGIVPAYRLLAHAAAAAAVIYGGLPPPAFELPGMSWHWPHLAGTALSALFVIWMINLYNFMDGMDGFAGGMAVVGFGAFALLGWQSASPSFAALSLIAAAGAAGFLIFNFPPARIFMGDTGSSALGLLAAALILWAARDGIFPPWVGLLVFSPFIVDASVTLVRRLVRRDKIWQAHKTHYYQRLVQYGWSHKKTVLAEYVLMLLCAGSAILGLRQSAPVQWAVMCFWALAYAFLAWSVERHDRRVVDEMGSQ